ncbi:non-hydrolyzing UDP-N-acetylglucosamine 2-epimerase [Winogradskyella sp.]|uniref:non-hydrolyzing UDP-N-acetylglucosamine 2-epimerase n=1 Tax=Winogradskyella sp. TaxID=1883156 RepID=UPI00261403F7|nr:UDP-N-acetylglucosamine 2-epimerase (non-hydrolyzing) [Winogradskyella sp.]
MKKIITVVGARPQFVKAAVLSRLIRSDKWNDKFSEVLVHTGQHYDYGMSDVFFEEMEIPKPDYNLNIGSGTHGKMTGEMLIKIEEVLINEKPDFVLIYGDTNSTLAAALAASKLHIKLIHVEAGLRSFWKAMPEEQNRICSDHLSDFLFCPTDTAVRNLLKEGLTNGVHNVGDIMFDAFVYYNKKIESNYIELFEKLLSENNIKTVNTNEKFFLLTIHRAENTDSKERLTQILDALNALDCKAIYPAHPRTIKQMNKFGLQFSENINVIKPVGYFDMLVLMKMCDFIVTDSGGLQKEAYFAKRKCITLRDQTEWVETVNSGCNFLVGSDKDLLDAAVKASTKLSFENKHFGNGDSASLMLELMLNG